MNLYNLIFEMVVCIQIEIYEFVYRGGRVYPKGRGSRVYPNGQGSRFYTLIPFLTQPPHERTQIGRGSRVYPNWSGQPGVP